MNGSRSGPLARERLLIFNLQPDHRCADATIDAQIED
jgi:hypothetical protein